MRVPVEWLKEYVDVGPSSANLAKRLTLSGLEARVFPSGRGGDDGEVLEVDVLPNRGDCESVLGLAREIAAVLGKKIKSKKQFVAKSSALSLPSIKVKVLAKKDCLRYSARVIKNVQVASSPQWLQRRLIQCGIRPINNVVDITNYVLLELGQPLHAFDLNLFSQNKLVVRKATPGEKIILIDGSEINLSAADLVIADGANPVALAGIMGGRNTEINAATKTVLLESASFAPTVIYRTARQTKLRTESSIRFEKGVDIETVSAALDLGTRLLVDLCGGQVVEQKIDQLNAPLKKKQITLNLANVVRVTGQAIGPGKIVKILNSLGFGLAQKPKGKNTAALRFNVPYFRQQDVCREIDLIEEILRIYGYDHVPATLPNLSQPVNAGQSFDEFVELIREEMVSVGLDEIKTFSMIAPDDFDRLGILPSSPERNVPKISNPLSVAESCLRSTLLPGILKNITLNQNWQISSVSIFEIDKIFSIKDGANRESWSLAIGITDCPKISKWHAEDKRKTDFYFLKGLLERILAVVGVSGFAIDPVAQIFLQPGQAARCSIKSKPVAWLGKIHPTILNNFDIKLPVLALELNLTELFRVARSIQQPKKFMPLPKYPAVERDIALVVSAAISFDLIKSKILETAGSFVESIEMFDYYVGASIPEGHHSLALHVVYRDSQKTMLDEGVNHLHSQVLAALKNSLKIEIRM